MNLQSIHDQLGNLLMKQSLFANDDDKNNKV